MFVQASFFNFRMHSIIDWYSLVNIVNRSWKRSARQVPRLCLVLNRLAYDFFYGPGL